MINNFLAMNKRSKAVLILSILLFGLYLYSATILIVNILRFSGVETALRIFFVVLSVTFIPIFFFRFKNLIQKRQGKRLLIFLGLLLLISFINIFIGHNLGRIYNGLKGMNKETVVYSSSLVSLIENDDITIGDIIDSTIGILSDENSITGYQIPMEIVDENNLEDNNELVEYTDFIYMLNDLYSGDIDYIFLDSNYVMIYNGIESFENIASETFILATKTKEGEKSEEIKSSSSSDLTEPFTVLIMGVDSKYEGIENATAYNGDALMLLTFNPRTLNATILSIPRDTYVPVTCFVGNYQNKITHAAWQGEGCVIDTIENFTGITIDYYVKVNFKGVVDIVDTLGGITVDVPITFCEQNSDRKTGENEICLDAGVQELDGEEALALARHRKTIDDFQRGQNQQLVIKGMLAEVEKLRNVEDMYNLLDAVSDNIDTNLTTNQILSFYNVLKDIVLSGANTDDIMSLERLYLSGYSRMIWDKWFELRLYDFVYYDGSLEDVVEAMEINLDIKTPTMIKEFSFSINEPYEEVIVGQGEYKETYKYPTTPGFVGEEISVAEDWANGRGLEFIIIEVDDNSVADGLIISQSIPWGKRLDEITEDTLTVEVARNYDESIIVEEEVTEDEETTDEEVVVDDTTEETGDEEVPVDGADEDPITDGEV